MNNNDHHDVPTSAVVPLILALDVGSSSVRCSAFTAGETNGDRLVESSAVAWHALAHDTGNLHAPGQLVEHIDTVVDQTLSKLSNLSSQQQQQQPYDIVAVAFSSFVMNLLAVDADGRLVEEATLSYANHTPQVQQEVQALKRQLGESGAAALYQRTGAPLHASYALPQLRVLYRQRPDVACRIAHWHTLRSFCGTRWFVANTDETDDCWKAANISYSEASWTGLLDFVTCTYDETALQLLPEACRRALPGLADLDGRRRGDDDDKNNHLQSLSQQLSPAYRQRWPQLSRARFVLGVGDGACANVGSKCTIPQRIACTIGTSAAARICLFLPVSRRSRHGDDPQQQQESLWTLPPGLFCYRIDAFRVLVGGALTDGGSVVEWARQLLRLEDSDSFATAMQHVAEQVQQQEEDKQLLRQSAGDTDKENAMTSSSSGLTMLPFLSGERSTGFRSGANGVLGGLTRDTTSTDLLQACLESVALRLGAIIQLLQQVIPSSGDEPVRIIASGKALERNAVWRRIIANATGLPVILDTDTTEGTSRGAARIAQDCLGRATENYDDDKSRSTAEPLQHTISSVPNPAAAATAYWKQRQQEQETLLDHVAPWFESM